MNIHDVPNDNRDAEIHLKGRKLALNGLREDLINANMLKNCLVIKIIDNHIGQSNVLMGLDDE